jgi:fungalysin metallopeptidase (M36)/peptidase M28-like protein
LSTEIAVIFFDLGDTIGTAVLAPEPVHLVSIDVFPFVPGLLQNLLDRGIRLGIISNTGTDKAADVDQVLAQSSVLSYFDPALRIYSAEVGLLKNSTAVFELATRLANMGQEPQRCLFVGEDGSERSFAIKAGMRATPHPLLVLEVLGGHSSRFVRIIVPALQRDRVFTALERLPLVALHVSGMRGNTIYAITSQRVATDLINMRLVVDLLGSPSAPDTADLYLFRDDVAAASGFMSADGESGRFFAGPDESALLLSADRDGLIVALPAGRSPGEFHFCGARHGHTLRLMPDPLLLKPATGGSTPARSGAFAVPSGTMLGDGGRMLSAEERSAFAGIEANDILDVVERYSGKRPLSSTDPIPVQSRHIAHLDNARVVAALAKELQAVGSGQLNIRLIQFSHRGLTIHNVEAELKGTSPEVVLITAHLDSTAASDQHYDEVHGSAPGADDDASGVAAVLRAAECIVSLAKGSDAARRTIRFVLFNAEEEGLVGSRVYARQQRMLEVQVVAVYQMDMIGFHSVQPRSWEVHVGFSQSTDVERRSALLAEVLANTSSIVSPDLELPQVYRSRGDPDGDPAAGRSDHAPFHAQGYAACVISEDFFLGPDSDSPQPQANPNYHKASDVQVDGSFAADIARAVAAAAWYSARSAVLGPPQFAAPNNEQTWETPMPPREIDTSRMNSRYSSGPQGLGWRTARALTEARSDSDPLLALREGAVPQRLAHEGSSLVDRALNFAKAEHARTNGFSSGSDVSDFVPDPIVQRTSSGAATVHLQQSYRGIPAFRMGKAVRFEPHGKVLDSTGASMFLGPDFDVEPRLSAVDAALKAAEHLSSASPGQPHHDEFGQVTSPPSVCTKGFVPRVIASFPTLPSQATVLDWFSDGGAKTDVNVTLANKPFENPIPIHLVLFDEVNGVRLGWHGIYTFPDYLDQFVVIVSADMKAGEILYARSMIHNALAEGLVFEFSPGVAARKLVKMPRPVTDFPLMPGTPLAGFPAAWVEGVEAIGNSTIATLNFTNKTLAGTLSGTTVSFTPTREDGDDQKLLNIFYFCNYMHDFLYMLGFDEAAGNFQKVNFTHIGIGGDPVRARAHSGPVNGTANMSTAADGLPPVMNMGLVAGTGRHTAFDADVVLHEYTHGLTNRLVGGTRQGHALEAPQSEGMGEGWSDFFALTIQNYFRAAQGQAEKTVTGDWVVNRPMGIRSAPYDDHYQYGYGHIAAFPRDPQTGLPDEHQTGEIWCATLMMMSRRLRASLGDDAAGYRLAWQLVVDGLKLTPANPTFLQARDAILLALDHMRDQRRVPPAVYGAALTAAWTSFARFGMGAGARSDDAGVDSIVADTSLPAEVRASVPSV